MGELMEEEVLCPVVTSLYPRRGIFCRQEAVSLGSMVSVLQGFFFLNPILKITRTYSGSRWC